MTWGHRGEFGGRTTNEQKGGGKGPRELSDGEGQRRRGFLYGEHRRAARSTESRRRCRQKCCTAHGAGGREEGRAGKGARRVLASNQALARGTCRTCATLAGVAPSLRLASAGLSEAEGADRASSRRARSRAP